MRAFEHCVGAHRDDARWIAFLDVDEFLFSPTGAPLPEVLRDYEQRPAWSSAASSSAPRGTSTKPSGLVIESYVERRPVRPDDEALFKSIVEPVARRAVPGRAQLRVPRRRRRSTSGCARWT